MTELRVATEGHPYIYAQGINLFQRKCRGGLRGRPFFIGGLADKPQVSTRQDPAICTYTKIPNYCQINGQGPPLSYFCNIPIIQMFKIRPYDEPRQHAALRTESYLHTRPPFSVIDSGCLPQRAVVEQRVNLCHLDNMSPSGVCLVAWVY